MKSLQKGFTLIELMIVVAIIAILAALALPAYQDYTVRAKVSEALTAASSPKSAVSEGFQVNGSVGIKSAAGALASEVGDTKSKYVDNMVISDADATLGMITVTLSKNGTESGFPTKVLGTTLVLTPSVNGNWPADGASGPVDWGCASIRSDVAKSHGISHAQVGTLPAKYAPSECR